MEKEDIGMLGVLFIFLRLCGIVALLLLPMYLIYRLIYWLLDN